MKIQMKIFCGLLVVSVLQLVYIQPTNSQTIAEIFNKTDSSMTIRLENLDLENPPTKMLLLCDSNIISLETSSRKSKIHTTMSGSVSNNLKYSSNLALFAVDLEKEIEVKDWMLIPFSKTKNIQGTDTELELTLENWMFDLNAW